MYIILGISLLNFMICTLFIQVKKNILNQYIFLDDLVSNIFQIKKVFVGVIAHKRLSDMIGFARAYVILEHNLAINEISTGI